MSIANVCNERISCWSLPVMLLIALLGSSSEARTWRVEKDGSGDFTILQDAVDAAASGDTLRVGPGRFSDYEDFVLSGNEWHLYAYVQQGSLTVIGAGEGVTFIGPDAPDTWEPGDLVIGLLFWPSETTEALRISSLTFSDSVTGVYIQYGGYSAERCIFERLKWGLRTLAGGTLHDCRFDRIRDVGIAGFSPASSVRVDQCVFTDSSGPFNFQLIPSVIVTNCEIQSCLSAGMFDRSAGSMRNCTVRLDDMYEGDYGLEVYGPGTYTITDNTFDGGGFNIIFGMGASNVTCERNVFSGSRDRAIHITSCAPRIHNNDILKGDGVAVRLGGYSQLPDLTVDMTANYWGTTSADSISAWIIDGHDVSSPPMHGFVNFEPFSPVSVPGQKKSLGGVKAMFR